MRRVTAACATLAAFACIAAAAPAAPVPQAPVFAVSGRGWGHGVGLSQWGAYGYAGRGWTYDAIVGHYYPGTVLGSAPVARVRVLLADGRTTATIGSAAPFRLRDGSGQTYEIAARRVAFGPGLRIDTDGTGTLRKLPGPLTFTPLSQPLELGGARYRGTLEASVVKGRLRVVNGVGLEAYLWGVVPGEMPYTWPAEALKAQAVVARSYALAVRRSGTGFDLYADVRSQVYGGMAAERPAATAAVSATAGEVVLWQDEVATTYFFSTSGGKTANIEDVWTGAKPVPYLVSVPDPYDTLSPHHRWGPVRFTAARLARTLGLGAPVLDALTTRNRSGRVAELVAQSPAGEQRVTGGFARDRLGLRSSWFSVAVLRLDRPGVKAVTWGAPLSLAGLARTPWPVTLERRLPGAGWEKIGPVQPATGATVRVGMRPRAKAEYRLASGTLRTPAVTVRVAPSVRLEAGPAAAGSVRPVLAGATVQLQRLDGSSWRPAGSTSVAEDGTFALEGPLDAGTYRARVPATRGLVTGLSRPVVVAPR